MKKILFVLALCLSLNTVYAKPLRDVYVERASAMNAVVIVTLTTGEKIEGTIPFYDAVSMIIKPAARMPVCINRERVAAMTTKSKDIPITKDDVDTSF